jgi:hypothetical protein
MLLREWKQYLTDICHLDNNTNTHPNANTWDSLTDYFTFANASDVLGWNSAHMLSEIPVYMPYWTTSIWNFNDVNLTFTNADINTTQFYTNINEFVSNLANVVYLKNDSLKLSYFFPEYFNQENIINLELWFYDLDNTATTQHDISSLDVKLYYPEPFIASPSFAHEEIWFIHILHYNYWLWFFLFL